MDPNSETETRNRERNTPEIRLLWQQFVKRSDPTAFDRLFALLAESVLQIVRAKFSRLTREDIEDAVAVAFTSLATRSASYDERRSSILNYLVLIAERRCLDRVREQRRHIPALSPTPNDFVPDVALEPTSANISQQPEWMERIPDPTADTALQAMERLLYEDSDPMLGYRPEISVWLEQALPDPRDRALLEMLAAGRANVETFARLYSLEGHPIVEQQREMKRNRERVEKRMLRRRKSLEELLTDLGDP